MQPASLRADLRPGCLGTDHSQGKLCGLENKGLFVVLFLWSPRQRCGSPNHRNWEGAEPALGTMPVPMPSSRLLQVGRGGERGPGPWEGTGCPQTWQRPGGVHLSSRGPAPRGFPRHDPHSFTLGPEAISGRREKARHGPSFVWSCKGDLALSPAGMTAASPESEPQCVSLTTLWTGVQEAGARFVPVPSTATVRVPLHTGICPRGPTGQGPPNSSLLLAVVSTTLLARGRKAVMLTAMDPPARAQFLTLCTLSASP